MTRDGDRVVVEVGRDQVYLGWVDAATLGHGLLHAARHAAQLAGVPDAGVQAHLDQLDTALRGCPLAGDASPSGAAQ